MCNGNQSKEPASLISVSAVNNGESDQPTPTINASRSNAGPTPFHRRQSYIVLDGKEKARFKWLIYDNNGSYNGWFDWLPVWMRIGYWSPFAVLFLAVFYTSAFWYRPRPLEFATFFAMDDQGDGDGGSDWFGMPRSAVLDASIFLWGMVVIVYGFIKYGTLAVFYMSFTGWSWNILTARAGLEFGAWAAATRGHTDLAIKLATYGSSLRFTAAMNAFVTFTVWNFVLLPMIYFIATPPGEKRRNFLKWNTGFFMVNIHCMNLPMALVNIVYGGYVRTFTDSDLWVSYLVVMLYSMLYLFVMDRLGLHFYPIFCPRSASCAISFGSVLFLYYYMMHKGNELILHWNPNIVTT